MRFVRLVVATGECLLAECEQQHADDEGERDALHDATSAGRCANLAGSSCA